MQAAGPLDALFIHTQVPAVLNQRWMARIPDGRVARRHPDPVRRAGRPLRPPAGQCPRRATEVPPANRRCLQRAVHIVAWSEWTKQGIVDGYGVSADRVTVIPPGVTPSLWYKPVTESRRSVLPASCSSVVTSSARAATCCSRFASCGPAVPRPPGGQPDVELPSRDERTPVPERSGVHVHADLGPNSPISSPCTTVATSSASPPGGDCLPMVLSEAGAAAGCRSSRPPWPASPRSSGTARPAWSCRWTTSPLSPVALRLARRRPGTAPPSRHTCTGAGGGELRRRPQCPPAGSSTCCWRRPSLRRLRALEAPDLPGGHTSDEHVRWH